MKVWKKLLIPLSKIMGSQSSAAAAGTAGPGSWPGSLDLCLARGSWQNSFSHCCWLLFPRLWHFFGDPAPSVCRLSAAVPQEKQGIALGLETLFCNSCHPGLHRCARSQGCCGCHGHEYFCLRGLQRTMFTSRLSGELACRLFQLIFKESCNSWDEQQV